MGFELRATDDPQRFDIVDGHGRIGKVWRGGTGEEGTREEWFALIQRARPWAFDWVSEPQASAAAAVREARTMYRWLLKERRQVAPWCRAVSIPMGGQSRRR